MQPMSLLDRIGKVLKGATAGSAPKSDPPATTETPKPAATAKAPEAPSSTTATPSTKDLFGGEADTTAPVAKTADAPSTKGLFGGTDADASPVAETKTAEAPPDTKGLFGAAAVATETVEKESTGRKLQSDTPSSTVPEPD